MTRKIWILIAATLTLTACINRETADAKLVKGCLAGAETFLAESITIKEVKNQTFADAEDAGQKVRKVTITAIEGDGWYDGEEQYTCLFVEEFAPFQIKHNATIHQLKLHGETYGQENSNIRGTMEDLEKLTQAVESAM